MGIAALGESLVRVWRAGKREGFGGDGRLDWERLAVNAGQECADRTSFSCPLVCAKVVPIAYESSVWPFGLQCLERKRVCTGNIRIRWRNEWSTVAPTIPREYINGVVSHTDLWAASFGARDNEGVYMYSSQTSRRTTAPTQAEARQENRQTRACAPAELLFWAELAVA